MSEHEFMPQNVEWKQEHAEIPTEYLSCSCRRQMPRLSTKKEIVGNVVVTLLTVGFNSCLFASVKFAPLGTVGCLYRTAVMVFCMILSRIIMKEKITIPKVSVNVR